MGDSLPCCSLVKLPVTPETGSGFSWLTAPIALDPDPPSLLSALMLVQAQLRPSVLSQTCLL